LAIAGSIEEIFAEPFEAIGEAVAFLNTFSAKGKSICHPGGMSRTEYELKYYCSIKT
jgi:hypothetical protein